MHLLQCMEYRADNDVSFINLVDSQAPHDSHLESYSAMFHTLLHFTCGYWILLSVSLVGTYFWGLLYFIFISKSRHIILLYITDWIFINNALWIILHHHWIWDISKFSWRILTRLTGRRTIGQRHFIEFSFLYLKERFGSSCCLCYHKI